MEFLSFFIPYIICAWSRILGGNFDTTAALSPEGFELVGPSGATNEYCH